MTDSTIESIKAAAVTQDDLFRLDAQDLHVEVVDGEIVAGEKSVPLIHIFIIQGLFRLLDLHVVANQLGIVFSDGARFILKGTPEQVILARRPDLAFVRTIKLDNLDVNLDFYGAPDLVVEVISPGQTIKGMVRRFSDYFEAGAEEGWLIQPRYRRLHQYRADADDVRIYEANEQIDTTALFPGLVLTLDMIMQIPGLPKAK